MESGGHRRSFQQLRNVLASWGAFALSASAGLFLSPFVVDRLGADVYGLWTIVGSLTGSLSVFDLGMRSAVVRLVSRDHARGNHEEASNKAGSLLALYSLAAMLVLLAGAVLTVRLPTTFSLPEPLVTPGRFALMISVASLALNLTGSVSAGVVMAMERIDLVGIADVAFEAFRIVLVLSVLGSGGGLVGLAAIGFTLTIGRFLFLSHTARRIYPELRMVYRKPSRNDVRTILDISLFSTLIYTSVTLAGQAGTLIIGATLPLTIAAYYAIGATLPQYAYSLNRPIAQTVHPRASRLEAENDAEGLRRMILTTGKASALVLLPVVLTFIVRGQTFVGIWQGPEFREPSGTVLALLSIGVFFSGPRHVIQAAFVGSGRHRTLGPWYIAEALIRIAMTFILVKAIGLTGPAWAGVLPGIIMAAGVLPVLCERHFGVPVLPLIAQIWGRTLLSMLPFALALVALERWWPASDYLWFFAQILFVMPLAVFGAVFVGLEPHERSTMLGPLVRRLRSRFLHFGPDRP
jgi:O-antigen/teichoic acid export membrane protein